MATRPRYTRSPFLKKKTIYKLSSSKSMRKWSMVTGNKLTHEAVTVSSLARNMSGPRDWKLPTLNWSRQYVNYFTNAVVQCGEQVERVTFGPGVRLSRYIFIGLWIEFRLGVYFVSGHVPSPRYTHTRNVWLFMLRDWRPWMSADYRRRRHRQSSTVVVVLTDHRHFFFFALLWIH